jgi:hypothetical protein
MPPGGGGRAPASPPGALAGRRTRARRGPCQTLPGPVNAAGAGRAARRVARYDSPRSACTRLASLSIRARSVGGKAAST